MANPAETPQELQNLQRYYETNLKQTSYIFLGCMGAVIAGFITLLAGVWMLYSMASYAPGIVATISGVLLEFICASFFYLYNKNIQLMLFFMKSKSSSRTHIGR